MTKPSSTHCLSFLSRGALRARKSSITLLSLFPRGPNQSNKTWVTLKKGTGGQGEAERRRMDVGGDHRGQSPENKRYSSARPEERAGAMNSPR